MLYSFLFGTILLSTKATEENKTNISTTGLNNQGNSLGNGF